MKRRHDLQIWHTMLLGNVGTKWLRFKTVFLDLVEDLSPHAWPKRRIAKPSFSRHIGVMQEHWACFKNHYMLYTWSLRRERSDIPLTNFFQASLESGRLPNDWLTEHVLPIYKSGQCVDPKIFRPVSLTCT